MAYLENINSPKDIKKMKTDELNVLAKEIRKAILKRNSLAGGHVGPNLGFVEATLALHYVFSSPKDKIVFDVSHQCYAHKIITGRKKGFLNVDDFHRVSGYTNPKESEHDHFIVGHTSTSVSLASGLAKARDLRKEKFNVIAVIGDGSLSGGEAFEGLDFAGSELNSNFIVVVNDNQMSIAENHGGLYKNLALLRETKGEAELNFFKALGFDYLYVDEGNNIEALIKAFKTVKGSSKPVVVHLNTVKGKGYAPAEKNKEPWHWHLPFEIRSGALRTPLQGESYTDITHEYFLKRVKKGERIVMLTAGTPGVLGFTPERREEYGEHYVDVGIAEEHAVAMASALAKGGCKPVFSVMSSFVQRTYDQLSQDLALNNNPALILVYYGGLSSADATHLGNFDIALIANIPNIIYLAPATKEEYITMLDWAMRQTLYPVVVRVPTGEPVSGGVADMDFSDLNCNLIVEEGKEVAIIAAGSFLQKGREVVERLKRRGIKPTLINPLFLSGVDDALLTELERGHQIVATLEDGALSGGYGEKISRYYGTRPMRVLNFGAKKEFTDRASMADIYSHNHLFAEQVVMDIMDVYRELRGESC